MIFPLQEKYFQFWILSQSHSDLNLLKKSISINIKIRIAARPKILVSLLLFIKLHCDFPLRNSLCVFFGFSVGVGFCLDIGFDWLESHFLFSVLKVNCCIKFFQRNCWLNNSAPTSSTVFLLHYCKPESTFPESSLVFQVFALKE